MTYEMLDISKHYLKQQINAFHSSTSYEHKIILIFQVDFREAFTATGYVLLSITKLHGISAFQVVPRLLEKQ